MITDYSVSVSLDEKCDWEALSESIVEIMAQRDCDDECYLPPDPIKPSNTKIVNRLHHRILYHVCVGLVGEERCPHINMHGRFENVNFIPYIIEIASRVVNVVTQERLKSQTGKRELYRYLSLIVVFLQYIVAARWYLCEYHQTRTMAVDRDLLGHHNVFFLFLAFRVVLMYLLPYEYFVQRVPSSLPTYVKEHSLLSHCKSCSTPFDL